MRETLGDRHTNTLTAINNLGSLLKEAGDFAAAEPLLRTAVEVQRETLGERHPYTLFSTNTLGQLLHAKGDFTAAERLLRDALKLQRETLGDRHPDTRSPPPTASARCCTRRATPPIGADTRQLRCWSIHCQ